MPLRKRHPKATVKPPMLFPTGITEDAVEGFTGEEGQIFAVIIKVILMGLPEITIEGFYLFIVQINVNDCCL